MEPYTGSFRVAGHTGKQTCKQCRQRKVRCDGQHSVCGHCDRLGYVCSFSQPGEAGGTVDFDTPLSLPRRRTGIACRHCRDQKIKCSGQLPQCTSCKRRSISCIYPAAKRQVRSPRVAPSEEDTAIEQHQSEETDRSSYSPQTDRGRGDSLPHGGLAPAPALLTTLASQPSRREGRPITSANCICYPSALRQDTGTNGSTKDSAESSRSSSLQSVDAFFQQAYPLPSYSFLHPATTRARWAAGKLDDSLKFAICGLVILYSDPQTPHIPGSFCACRGTSWIEAAEAILWQHLETPTISRLQALLLVINHRMETGRFQRAFMLASLAARFAVAMRLNHEHRDLSSVTQEVRRRIMWGLKLLERSFSIGLPEFELCPFEVIYLQLPCSESDFGTEPPGDGGAYKLCIGLENMRRDVMKLNRGISLCDKPLPELTGLIHEFESKLASIGAMMPSGTDFSFAEIGATLDSAWISRHVFMHLSWHEAHCDIYRLLLPGFQEAAPQPVLAGLTAEYLLNAETQCLRHASSIINILTSLNQQCTRPRRLEFDSAICAYQACRLILFISRFGKGQERPTPEYATSRADLCLTALKRFFTSSALVKPIIDEVERTIKAFVSSAPNQDVTVTLSAHPSPAPGGRGSTRQNSRAWRAMSMQKGRERLAIHSLLRRADFWDGDDADEDVPALVSGTSQLASTPGSVATRESEAVFVPGVRYPEQERSSALVYPLPSPQLESLLKPSVTNLPGLMPFAGASVVPALGAGPEGNRDGAATEDWELDSFTPHPGWDMQFPLFPWYGLQDQDWFAGNF
ncbi:hypothetical protein GQ53DRAFT_878286 [Thozetella sp. PMI_491]|nr:hypothetical protein GQ53DRAFT_878286 [Thozetella sp. PMI_491]